MESLSGHWELAGKFLEEVEVEVVGRVGSEGLDDGFGHFGDEEGDDGDGDEGPEDEEGFADVGFGGDVTVACGWGWGVSEDWEGGGGGGGHDIPDCEEGDEAEVERVEVGEVLDAGFGVVED